MELWEAVKIVSPWAALAVVVAVLVRLLAPIITNSLVNRWFFCPVCGVGITSQRMALRILAAAHQVPLDIPLREMRERLAELADADIHRQCLWVENHHHDGNRQRCLCLIMVDANGQLRIASYS